MLVFGKKSKSYPPIVSIYLVVKHLTETHGIVCNNKNKGFSSIMIVFWLTHISQI